MGQLKIVLVAAMMLMAALISCGKDKKSQPANDKPAEKPPAKTSAELIFGKWEAHKFIMGDQEEAIPPGQLTFDFQQGGKVAVTELNVTDHVTYKFMDQQTMEFTEPDGTPFTVKVSISGDQMTLEITDYNKKFELTRLNNPRPGP